MENQEIKICPVCGEEIASCELYFCPDCGTAHHEVCRQQGCGNPDCCGKAPAAEEAPAPAEEASAALPAVSEGEADPVEAEVNPAIAEFNAQIDARRKKKKTWLLWVVIGAAALAVLIGAAFGVQAYFENQTEKIAAMIRSGDGRRAAEAYENMGALGGGFAREELVDVLDVEVKGNYYLVGDGVLVDPAQLDQMEQYQQICDALDVSSADGTNIAEYLETVLQFRQYEEYIGLYNVAFAALDDYDLAFDCLDDMTAAESFYVMELYMGLAVDYMQDAVDAAEACGETDPMAREFVDALQVVLEGFEDIYYGWDIGADTDAALETVGDYYGELSEVLDGIADIWSELTEFDF